MCWQTLPKSLSERRPEQNDDPCLWLRLALDENAVLNNVIEEEEEEPKRDEERFGCDSECFSPNRHTQSYCPASKLLCNERCCEK
jgi:hypothetical protein